MMMFFGALIFLSFGICVGNSIEAKNSERVANFLTVLTVGGLLSLIIGIVGYLITINQDV